MSNEKGLSFRLEIYLYIQECSDKSQPLTRDCLICLRKFTNHIVYILHQDCHVQKGDEVNNYLVLNFCKINFIHICRISVSMLPLLKTISNSLCFHQPSVPEKSKISQEKTFECVKYPDQLRIVQESEQSIIEPNTPVLHLWQDDLQYQPATESPAHWQ